MTHRHDRIFEHAQHLAELIKQQPKPKRGRPLKRPAPRTPPASPVKKLPNQ